MRFAVDESLRGGPGTEVIVETGGGGGDCGTPLPPGGKFLIFAYRNDSGQLWTGLCSGNRRITDTPADDKVLEELRSLVKSGKNSIFGSVFRTKPAWKNDDVSDDSTPKPVQGLVLSAQSLEHRATTTTKKDGTFEFSGLPEGKYAVTPNLPKGMDFDHEYEDRYEAALSDGACANINFKLQPATRIRGHVTRPPGTKDKSVEVVAIPVQLRKLNQFSGKWDFIDENDRFDLWPLPPGDYFVGVNINSSPKEQSPFPPIYYPGVTTQKAASIVHVEEGEIKDLEMHLPEVAEPRIVYFTAIGLDGKPMKHIYIQREDLRHPGDAASYVNVDLDKNGAGNLIVFAGYSYHLHGSEGNWCSKPVSIPAGREPIHAQFVMNSEGYCDIARIDGLKH